MKKNVPNEDSDENKEEEENEENENEENEENENEENENEENEEYEDYENEENENEENENEENENEENNEEEKNEENENNKNIIENEEEKEKEKLLEKENERFEKLKEENIKKKEEERIRLIKNYENSIKTYNKLKDKITLICIEIETDLNSIYYPKKEKNNEEEEKNKKKKNIDDFFLNKEKKPNTLEKDLINEQKQTEKNFQKTINYFKHLINKTKNELEIALTMNKIVEYENLIKEKINYVKKLKNENIGLNKIRENQITKIGEYQIKVLQNDEINNINNKIKSLKELIKTKKDFYQLNQEKIRLQLKEKRNLENKCNLINDNIKYKKKEKINEVENENENENKNNIFYNYIDMKETFNNKKNEFTVSETNYKSIIEDQEKTMARLNKEISLLNTEIRKNEKNIFFAEKKKKKSILDFNYLKRNKLLNNEKENKENEQIKNNNDNNNIEVNISHQNLTRKKSIEEKKYIPFNKSNKSVRQQPFNIVNFMENIEKNRQKKNKTETMKLIDNLKFDIESLIKKTKLDEETENYIKKIANTEGNIIERKKI